MYSFRYVLGTGTQVVIHREYLTRWVVSLACDVFCFLQQLTWEWLLFFSFLSWLVVFTQGVSLVPPIFEPLWHSHSALCLVVPRGVACSQALGTFLLFMAFWKSSLNQTRKTADIQTRLGAALSFLSRFRCETVLRIDFWISIQFHLFACLFVCSRSLLLQTPKQLVSKACSTIPSYTHIFLKQMCAISALCFLILLTAHSFQTCRWHFLKVS